MEKLTEDVVKDKVIEFLTDSKNGNWHIDKLERKNLHEKGCDIKLIGGGGNSEYFYIECKGKSYAKSEKSRKSINREGWLIALGQIVTRMKVKSNGAYKYGMGLYWQGAQKALERIPRNIAIHINLHIFSVNDDGTVKKFTPGMFGKKYDDDMFK